MNTLKFILLTLVALFVGSLVNGAIVSISGAIIPPPAGADFTTEAGLKASAALMEPKHFILPWLAHVLGTLVGAFLASWWQPTRSLRAVLIIGVAWGADKRACVAPKTKNPRLNRGFCVVLAERAVYEP